MRFVICVLAGFPSAGTSLAQFNLGTITGTVADPNGGTSTAAL